MDEILKQLEALGLNVKSVSEGREALEKQINDIQTKFIAVQSQPEEVEKLKGELVELKNEIADMALKAPRQVKTEEVNFNSKEISTAIRNCFIEKGDFQELFTKALAIGGSSGEALAIDEELGRTVIERARENVTILGLIGNKTVGSVDYRELVLRGYPSIGDGTEQLAGVEWAKTTNQSYEEVALNAAKKYAKPQISDEASTDAHIDIWAHLQTLLAEEFQRTWASQVLFGDGTAGNLKGLLSSNRVNITATTGESWKSNDVRDFDYYPAMKTGSVSAFGANAQASMDFFIEVTTALPTAYLGSACWVMNRKTLGVVRKLRDADGHPFVTRENGAFYIEGYEVKVEDYMPNIAANALPVIFGDLSQAYCLCDIDDNFLVDPYTVDGAVVLKQSSRKGDIVHKNDSIVIVATTTNATS